jgi:hypothetical protein
MPAVNAVAGPHQGVAAATSNKMYDNGRSVCISWLVTWPSHSLHHSTRPGWKCGRGVFIKFPANDKWPPGIDLGGHQFWRQKVPLNKTPDFASEVVAN